MAIKVGCTSCGKMLQVKDELAGKKVKCPGCQTVFVALPASDKGSPDKPAASKPKPVSKAPPEKESPPFPPKKSPPKASSPIPKPGDMFQDDEVSEPKKPMKKGKPLPPVDDEPDLDDLFKDDEPTPPKKGKKLPPPAKIKDEDEEDSFEDDEPAPKKPVKKGKSAPAWDDDEEDEEEEERFSARTKAPAKKSGRGLFIALVLVLLLGGGAAFALLNFYPFGDSGPTKPIAKIKDVAKTLDMSNLDKAKDEVTKDANISDKKDDKGGEITDKGKTPDDKSPSKEEQPKTDDKGIPVTDKKDDKGASKKEGKVDDKKEEKKEGKKEEIKAEPFDHFSRVPGDTPFLATVSGELIKAPALEKVRKDIFEPQLKEFLKIDLDNIERVSLFIPEKVNLLEIFPIMGKEEKKEEKNEGKKDDKASPILILVESKKPFDLKNWNEVPEIAGKPAFSLKEGFFVQVIHPRACLMGEEASLKKYWERGPLPKPAGGVERAVQLVQNPKGINQIVFGMDIPPEAAAFEKMVPPELKELAEFTKAKNVVFSMELKTKGIVRLEVAMPDPESANTGAKGIEVLKGVVGTLLDGKKSEPYHALATKAMSQFTLATDENLISFEIRMDNQMINNLLELASKEIPGLPK